jgi:hypothetical protein
VGRLSKNGPKLTVRTTMADPPIVLNNPTMELENEKDDDDRHHKVSVNLSSPTRMAIFAMLQTNGDLDYGAFTKVGKIFSVDRRTVSRIWERGQLSLSKNPNAKPDVSSRRCNSGRRPKIDVAKLQQDIRRVPVSKRRTLADTAAALGISPSYFFTLCRKKKLFRPVSLSSKPELTAGHKVRRVHFVRDRIDTTNQNIFNPQFHTIHIDEKWFQKQPTKIRCYAAIDEELPAPTTRHKSHMEKVMFLCAVARPRRFRLRRGAVPQVSVLDEGSGVLNVYNGAEDGSQVSCRSQVDCFDDSDNGSWYFDGKVGLYPLVEERIQQRRSVLHNRGDRVLVNVSMTKYQYERIILYKLLPDIVKRCPPEMRQ